MSASPVEDLGAFRSRARAWLDDADIPELPPDHDERFTVLRRWHHTLYRAGWVGIHA